MPSKKTMRRLGFKSAISTRGAKGNRGEAPNQKAENNAFLTRIKPIGGGTTVRRKK